MSLPSPFSLDVTKKNNAARQRKNANKKKKLSQLQGEELKDKRDEISQRRYQNFAASLNGISGISCKYCNINFNNQFELQQHRRSHQKCPYDECQFNANEATVANHIQYVHLKTNALIKIQDLSTPEQIEKWREERRKRYPTTANVLLRQQIQEIKQKRGEKLQDAKGRFGDHQQRDFVKNMGNKDKKRPQQNQSKANPRQRQNRRDFKEQVSKACEIIQKILPPEEHQEISPLKFKGTQHLKDYHKEEAKNIGGLSLLAAYGSDSESENESLTNEEVVDEVTIKTEEIKEEEVIKEEEIEEIKEEVEEIKEEIEEMKEDEAPEEEPTQRDDTQPILEKSPRKRKHVGGGARNNMKKLQRTALDYSKLRQIKSTNPFLEKLLHREIVHERNYLLQCVNYVVSNKFFGVGQDAEGSKNVKDEKKA